MINDFIQKNLLWILITLAGAGWTLFQYVQDERHEMKGTAELTVYTSDLNSVRREARQVQNYLELAPSEQYDQARKAQLRELEQEELELVEKLETLRKSGGKK